MKAEPVQVLCFTVGMSHISMMNSIPTFLEMLKMIIFKRIGCLSPNSDTSPYLQKLHLCNVDILHVKVEKEL